MGSENQRQDNKSWVDFFSYGLTVESHADAKRHVIARAALMNLILQDERWIQKCHEWTQEAVPHEVMRHARNLAVRVQIDTRAQDEFISAINEVESKTRNYSIVKKIVEFAQQELNLSWPWLIAELGESWGSFVLAAATRKQYTKTLSYAVSDLPAPNAEFHFKTDSHEPMEEAIKRFQIEAKEFEEALHQAQEKAQLDTGRSSDPDTIRRYTEWFYRARLLKESLYHIADSYNPSYDHKNVTYGIEQIERVLSLTPSWENKNDS